MQSLLVERDFIQVALLETDRQGAATSGGSLRLQAVAARLPPKVKNAKYFSN